MQAPGGIVNDIQRIEDAPDGITIYNNPAAIYAHEKNHRFYAVAPEGCGSYGSTPEHARELLDVIRREYAGGSEEGRTALRHQAAERVADILQANGERVIEPGR